MDQIRKAILQQQLERAENIAETFEKGQALPNGTIRRRPNGNFIKTPAGWKYHSSLSANSSNAVESANNAQAVRNAPAPQPQLLGIVDNQKVYNMPSSPEKESAEYVGLVESQRAYKRIATKPSMPKVGASVKISQQGAKLISLQPFEGKTLTVEKIVDTGLISEPQQVKVTDGKGSSIIVSVKDLQPVKEATKAASKEKITTFANMSDEGKKELTKIVTDPSLEKLSSWNGDRNNKIIEMVSAKFKLDPSREAKEQVVALYKERSAVKKLAISAILDKYRPNHGKPITKQAVKEAMQIDPKTAQTLMNHKLRAANWESSGNPSSHQTIKGDKLIIRMPRGSRDWDRPKGNDKTQMKTIMSDLGFKLLKEDLTDPYEWQDDKGGSGTSRDDQFTFKMPK